MEACWSRIGFHGTMFEHGHRRQKAVIIGGGMLAVFIIKKLHRVAIVRRLRKKVEEGKKRRTEEMEKLSRKLSNEGLTIEERESILKLSIKELQEKLQTGQISAHAVLMAYQSRALQVTKSTNSVVEIIKEAESIAKELDSSVKKKGPLHGIPVSLKECFFLEGYNTNLGLAQYLDDVSLNDGNIVKVLKSQGAVPFVRTNVPQIMMSCGCSNPVYGVTLNPHNLSRSSGGSSGGEASLIASKGSVLGIGTDMAGSLRIPANMCGIYSLKPTAGRLCGEPLPMFSPMEGQTFIQGTSGPMAQDVDGLVIAMETMLSPLMYDLDPTLPRLPFHKEIYESSRPLRIGYYVDLPTVQSVPSNQRGVLFAKDVLSNRGHTFVPFDPPGVEKSLVIYFGSLFGDGKMALNLLRDDLSDPSTGQIYTLLSLSRPIRWILTKVVSLFDKNLSQMIWRTRGVDSVYEWWELGKELHDYRMMFMKRWKELRLDAVICPGFAHPAQPSVFDEIPGGISYTALYNLLNYPVGSLPVTKVTSEDEENMKSFKPRKFFENGLTEIVKGSTGLPVNVQCVALPYQEELVLRLMKELETGLKHHTQ